jgi:hypothetical protein
LLLKPVVLLDSLAAAVTNSTETLTAAEAYVLHKRALEALKEQV